MQPEKLTLILWNLRSTYNVGAILRTADGLGVSDIICAGYTPWPGKGLPHEQLRLAAALHKTALGAETTARITHADDLPQLITNLQQSGTVVLALEQAPTSTAIQDFAPNRQRRYALILGEERHGLPAPTLAGCDHILEIPMIGQKESFNVSVAAAIAIWELTKPVR
jgi:tRNA G18 (ribose-2'-O)-methylase SpoU